MTRVKRRRYSGGITLVILSIRQYSTIFFTLLLVGRRRTGSDSIGPRAALSGPRAAGWRSDGWDGPAVQHIVGAADEGGAVGRQESDQFGHLLRPAGPPNRYAAQHVDDLLARRRFARAGVADDVGDHALGAGRLDEAGRDHGHAHAVGRDGLG